MIRFSLLLLFISFLNKPTISKALNTESEVTTARPKQSPDKTDLPERCVLSKNLFGSFDGLGDFHVEYLALAMRKESGCPKKKNFSAIKQAYKKYDQDIKNKVSCVSTFGTASQVTKKECKDNGHMILFELFPKGNLKKVPCYKKDIANEDGYSTKMIAPEECLKQNGSLSSPD